MSIEKGMPYKAWIVVAEEPRNPSIASHVRKFRPDQPLAVFPPQWRSDRLLPIVDGFVQFIMDCPEDALPYRKPNNPPYRAKAVPGQKRVTGGHDPYVHAIHVEDLTLCTAVESGESWFGYTRKQAKSV